jgi:hypothetical protein
VSGFEETVFVVSLLGFEFLSGLGKQNINLWIVFTIEVKQDAAEDVMTVLRLSIIPEK